MNQDRPGPDRDRLLVAEITGEARHRAKWRPLTRDEEAAAVAELRALAAGRADLLAEVAGIFEGTSEGELDEPFAQEAADLCRNAGADLEAIPRWVAEGSAGPRMPAGGRTAAGTCNGPCPVTRWLGFRVPARQHPATVNSGP